MNVKLTQSAMREVDRLSTAEYSRVIKALSEDLPASFEKDPVLELSELGADVRAHSIDDSDLFALYEVRDVNGDGTDEIVVLMMIARPREGSAATAAFERLPIDRMPRSAQIGHELLQKIQQL